MYQVPHCSACTRVTNRSGLLLALALLAALAALAALVSLWLGFPAAMAVTVTAMLLFIGIRKSRAPIKAPEGIFMLDYDKGSIWFVFKSRTYAERFCKVNLDFIRASAS